MPYAHRRIHDADSHVVETPDWLDSHAEAAVRGQLARLHLGGVRPGEVAGIERFREKHADPAYRAEDEAQILQRKNWAATGSFLREDRPRALDLLGFDVGAHLQDIERLFVGFLKSVDADNELAARIDVAASLDRAIAQVSGAVSATVRGQGASDAR